MSIMAIAKDQAGDLIRRRYLIVIFIVCLGIVGMFIGYLALMKRFMMQAANTPGASGKLPSEAEMREMMQLGVNALQMSLHAVVAFIGVMLAVSLMAYSVRSEIAKGTIRMVLSRPIRRYELVLGKWLGCVFILFLYMTFIGILVSGYTYFAFHSLPWLAVISLAMGFVKAITVGTIGMALSMLIHPLLSIVLAYFAGAEIFLTIAKFLDGAARQTILVPFYILPSYGAFDIYKLMMQGISLKPADLAYRVAYGLLLTAIALLVSMAAFEKKDLI